MSIVGLLFMAGTFTQRGMSFILLPFFLRFLLPSQYGQIVLWTTITTLLSVILALGLSPRVLRELLLQRAPASPSSVFVRVSRLISIAIPVVAMLVAGGFLLGSSSSWTEYAALSVVTAALHAGTDIYALAFLRARGSIRWLSVYLAIQALVGPPIRVLMVIVWHFGVLGWLSTDIIVNLCGCLLVNIAAGRRDLSRVRRSQLSITHGVATVLPMTVHQTGLWAESYGDRLVVGVILSSVNVGIYGVASQFSTIVRSLLGSANTALMAEFAPQTRTELWLHRVVRRQTTWMALGIAGMAAVSILYTYYAIPASYAQARTIAPILMGVCIPFIGYLICMNLLTMTLGNFTEPWKVTVVGGSVNLAMVAVGAILASTRGAAIGSLIGEIFNTAFVFRLVHVRASRNMEFSVPQLMGARLAILLAVEELGIVAGALMRNAPLDILVLAIATSPLLITSARSAYLSFGRINSTT